MNIKQQYIVLYAHDGKTSMGFVKLTFRGDEAEVSARAFVKTDAHADLILENKTQRARLPMQLDNGAYVANDRILFESDRIVVAVSDQKELLALGENSLPKANWNEYKRIANRVHADAVKKAENKRQQASFADDGDGMKQKESDRASAAIQPVQEGGQEAALKNKQETETKRTGRLPNVRRPLYEDQLSSIEDGIGFANAQQECSPQEDASICEAPDTDTMPIFDAQDQGVNEAAQRINQPVLSSEPIAAEARQAYNVNVQTSRQYVKPPPISADVQQPVRFRTGDAQKEIQLYVEGPYAQLWKWRRISSREKGYSYLMGQAEQDGRVVAVAVAVPGEYAPVPPANLQGFSVFRNGYWLLAQDASTGERIPI